MSLSLSNSRNNLHAGTSTRDMQGNPEPHSEELGSTSDITASSFLTTMVEPQTQEKKPQINSPKIKLQIPVEQSSSKLKEMNSSPRPIPKSPRLLKEKNSPSSKKISPRNELNSSSEKKYSPEKKEIFEIKKSNSSFNYQVEKSHPDPLFSSAPTFQIRRTKIVVPTKLLNEDKSVSTTATLSSPRNTSSSILATSASTDPNQKAAVNVSTPSIDACSIALLDLIFKKYEANPLTSGMVSAFGREDIYFAVKAIPRVLTHLTEFPDNGITSVSELLIALFGGELRNGQAWKKVELAINNGKSLDDGSISFGETDPDIKKNYFSLLKPHALNIADYILGKDKTIKKSVLPEGFINLLFEGDKRLLAICLTSTKLRAKEMNDARLHFLFDMVVTRFAQVLAMDKFSERPSQVESWFSSAIIEALNSAINDLSYDFLQRSNSSMPTDLKEHFLKKVKAEIQEEEAIINFKLMELKKNRISELQKKEMDFSKKFEYGRGHSRVNSHAMLANVKLERNYKKMLDEIKTECGFDEMGAAFLREININQNILFDSATKISVSNIILNMKLAVREYDEIKLSAGFPPDEKVKNIINNLDYILEKEFNAKQKRRTNAFSKGINFSGSVSQAPDGKTSEKNTTTPSISLSTATSTTESTTSILSVTTSTTVIFPQLNESSPKEKLEKKN